jgi:hypothetical protein
MLLGVALLGTAVLIVWIGRRYDFAAPARCTLAGSETYQVEPGVFASVVDVRIVDANTHQVVADRVGQWTEDDPTSTPEAADALARARLQSATHDYDCFYDPRNPTWTTTRAHGDYRLAWLSAALGIVAFGLGVLMLTAPPEGEATDGSPTDGSPHLSHEAFSKLERTLRLLPARPPASWGPYEASGETWICDIDGEIRMVATVTDPTARGKGKVYVSLGPIRKETGRVTDERARELLADFRGVGEFGEAARAMAEEFGEMAGALAEEQLRQRPLLRLYIARYQETAPTLTPSRLTRPKDEPLDDLLVQARQHLPEKLPEGWTTPVAVFDDEADEGKQPEGAWMFEADGAVVMMALCSSNGVVKLSVGFSQASLEPVHEWQAIGVLKHMRHIREFKQTAAPEDTPTIRVFLGDIGPTKEPVAMN